MDNQVPESKKNSSGIIVGVVIVVVLLAGGYFLFFNKSSHPSNPSQQQTLNEQTTTAPTVAPTTGEETKGSVKEFTFEASNFKFNLKEIKVNKGDTVKIHLVNKGGFHDWVLDEFNAKTDTIQGDQTADIEFVADKVGTFEYYCSVGNHRQMGMKGNLIVE